jgi:hypothetical protein
MAKRGKKLLVAVLILGASLLAVPAALWWYSGRAPVFRFLAGQQPIYHEHSRTGSIDVYSWPAEFESVAAQAREELLRAGFVDISSQGTSNMWLFSRPGLRPISVGVGRGKLLEQSGGITTFDGHTPGWVLVRVGQGRLTPFQYLRYLWGRITSPPPPPQPKSAAAQ